MNREPTLIATVNGSALAAALDDLQAFIGRGRDTLTAGVRVRAEALPRSLRLDRTLPGEVKATAFVAGIVPVGDVDITVSAAALAGAARRIGGHPATLSVIEVGLRGPWDLGTRTMLQVEGDGVTYRLITAPDTEWPDGPQGGLRHVAVLEPAALAVLARTEYAASRDCTLPILASTRLTLDNEARGGKGRIVAHATDRYRLMETVYAIGDYVVPEPMTLLLREGILSNVSRIANRRGQAVTVAVIGAPGEEVVTFLAGSLVILASTVAGTYPKVESLFPQDFSQHVNLVVDAAAMRKAVERVAWSAGNQPMELEAVGAELLVHTSGHTTEESATTGVALLEPIPRPVRVAFSPANLLALLASLRIPGRGERRVRFLVLPPTEETTPGSTRPVIASTPDLPIRHLAMPVRLADERARS